MSLESSPQSNTWCGIRSKLVMFMLTAAMFAIAIVVSFSLPNPAKESPMGLNNTMAITTEAMAPTGTPTTSPAPTFTMVPVTGVILLDGFPSETGWNLDRDSVIIKAVPVGECFGKHGGDYIVDTSHVQEGADCTFTIYDTASDGLCCEAGRGFYHVYLAEEADVPNGFVGQGSEFMGSETLRFVAI